MNKNLKQPICYYPDFINACKTGDMDALMNMCNYGREYCQFFIGNKIVIDIAYENGHIELAKMIISLRISMVDEYEDGNTNRTFGGYLDLPEHLTHHGLGNTDKFIIACKKGNLNVVKDLIYLDDMQYIWDLTSLNPGALDVAYICAGANGHLNIVKYLVENIGIKTNCIDKYFRYACQGCNVELLRFYVDLYKEKTSENFLIYTKDFTRVDKDNIHFKMACWYKRLDVVNYLCELCSDYKYDIKDDLIIPIIAESNSFKMI